MAIVSHPALHLTPRDEAIFEIQFLIDEAASSPDEISPHKLATEIWELVEARFARGWKAFKADCNAQIEAAVKVDSERRRQRRV